MKKIGTEELIDREFKAFLPDKKLLKNSLSNHAKLFAIWEAQYWNKIRLESILLVTLNMLIEKRD